MQWKNEQFSVNNDEVGIETKCIAFSGITGRFFYVIENLFLLCTILVGK